MLKVLVLAALLLVACREPESPPPLERVAHPSIDLPTADMARPAPLDAIVLRVPKDGGILPAVRLASGELLPFANAEERVALLLREAESAGRETDSWYGSKLDIVLFADAEAPWSVVREVLGCCVVPDVRAPRIWYAARNHEGVAGALPCFLPPDRGLCAPRDLVEVSWPGLRIARRSEKGISGP